MRVRVLAVVAVLSFVVGPVAEAAERTPLSGAIAGTVTNEDGAPVSGVCVVARPPGPGFGPEKRVDTRSDGTFWLTGLRDGAYLVSVAGCVTSPYEQVTISDPPLTVELGRATRIDVTLRRLPTIEGTVRTRDGRPLGGVCVYASAPGGGRQPVGIVQPSHAGWG
ncbi:MAG TPA: carboxypeptidase-like regulatory domain-containing protein, partial [Actinomycetota bacterium]|nr:carboxypeptidase-like regulatory domain-containing protein [Actinomycetota bacterium]